MLKHIKTFFCDELNLFLIVCLICLIFLSFANFSYTLRSNFETTASASQIVRDPYLQPFSRDSIWNLPIAKTAQLLPAGLQEVAEGFGNDEEIILKTTLNDPLVDVYDIGFGGQWNRRCLANRKIGQIHFPSNKTYPDPAGSSDTPNYSGAVLQPDGELFHFNAIATCGNNKIAVYPKNYDGLDRLENNLSLTGLGIQGGHGGSDLSGIGGSIRLGELTGPEPIRHALKLNVYANRFLSKQNGGYVWPAEKADSYYLDSYLGTNPNVKMGSLLTLNEGETLNSLGITDPIVSKFFQAAHDYGIYIVDDTAWDHYDIMAEEGVEQEVMALYGIGFENDSDSSYGRDMTKLLTALQVVTNNSVNTPGGGIFDPNIDNRRVGLTSCLAGENSQGCEAENSYAPTSLTENDISGLTLECGNNQYGTPPNTHTTCVFTLPSNKTLPPEFKLAIGSGPVNFGSVLQSCTITNTATSEVTCTGVPTGNSIGNMTIYASLVSGTKTLTGEMVAVTGTNFGAIDWVFNPDQGGTSPLFRSQDNISIRVNNFRTVFDSIPNSNTRYICRLEYASFGDRLSSNSGWSSLTPVPYITGTGANSGCSFNFSKAQRGNVLSHKMRLVITDTTNTTSSITNPNDFVFYNEYISRFQGAGVASGR